MINILTINIEDYYQVGTFSHLIPYREWERFEDRIRRNTERTLDLLRAADARATFFVSGWIAEKHGHLLRRIREEGHEIAAQGYYQQSVRNAPPAVFRDDLRRSRAIIEDAIGCAVLGFRVGRGWLGPDDLWVLEVLREEGFRYDSSICPLGRQFRDHPERFTLHALGEGAERLVEVPASAVTLCGYAVPFAGGNYLRQLPVVLTRRLSRQWVEKRGTPLVMYFHIWELDKAQPSITAAGLVQRLRHYRNLDAMAGRIRHLLETYRFSSVQHYLDLNQDQIPAHSDHIAGPSTAALAPNAEHMPLAPTPISILVPCYNEEEAIPYLARTLTGLITASVARLEIEIVLIDDGSSDATWRELELAFGGHAHCKLVRHARNRGIAAAIMTGFIHASCEYVAVIDADCTFDPFDIERMLTLMSDDVTVVAASPFHPRGQVRNVPGWRLLLSRGATALYARVFRNALSSYTSCFRIYRRAPLVGLEIDNPGFCGVTEIIARLDIAGHRIAECPVVLQVRLLGQSKIRLLRVVRDHLGLWSRLLARRWFGIRLPHEPAP